MHNLFNLSRFASLFKKYTLEHLRKNLLSVLALSAIMFSFFLLFILITRISDNGWQEVFFAFFFLLVTSVYACGVFSDLGDKRKAIAVLTLPATHLEKFAIRWIYSFIISPIVFVLVFYVVLIGAVSIADVSKSIGIINIFTAPFIKPVLFPLFVLFHSISLLGAIFFEKHHFIKTALTLFISYVALAIVNTQIIRGILGINIRSAVPFFGIDFMEKNNFYFLDLFSNQTLFLYASFGLVAILLWITAYFKLKEKQA